MNHLALCQINRPFHTCRPSAFTSPSSFPDHYTTLSVAAHASAPEIKKSFFALSKKYHPDRTRSLPSDQAEASANKFLEISEAYDVLSNQSKREKYDRERVAHLGPPPAGGSGFGGGTGSGDSSFNPGGRRASGLSRRRSQFRGPPPSFYRNGGWGGSGTKRQQAHAEGRQWSPDGRNAAGKAGGSASENQKNHAEEDGAWPFATDPNDVPHFDRRSHYRSQSSVEHQLSQGRARRRRKLWENAQEGMIYAEEGSGLEMKNFFLVGGIVAVGLAGPLLFLASSK